MRAPSRQALWAAPVAVALLLAGCGGPATIAGSRHRARGTTTTSATAPPGTSSTIASTATGSGTDAQRESATSGAITEPVTVATCPTTFGLSPTTTTPPATLPVQVPVTLLRQIGSVSLYEDAEGVETVLAPSGWSCSAVVGADGSATLTVVPPSEAGSLPRSVALPTDTEGMLASETSVCAGCTWEQVCGLFAAQAQQRYGTSFGTCAVEPPSAEAVDRLSSTTVGFEDPTGVTGTGALSGGPNPANGVVTFVPTLTGRPPPGALSYEATCTLPDAQHALCTVVLDDFLARYGTK